MQKPSKQHQLSLFFDNQELLSVEQISYSLNVSQKTVRHWIYKGKIPFYKIGRHIRFNPQEINDWIQERRIHHEH